MKVKLVPGLVLIVAGFVIPAAYAQDFTLTTSAANITSSKASIDRPGLAGNPLAIIVATPLGDTEKNNPHPVGAWYYNGKWNIFNTDHVVMPVNARYKIEYFLTPGPNQFLHIVTPQNLGDEGSYVDNAALNNNPNAQFKILQNYVPDDRAGYSLNPNEAKASYNSASGKWYIANVNGKRLYPNTAYSVVIFPDAPSDSNVPSPQKPIPISTRTREPITLPATQPPTTTRVSPANPVTPTTTGNTPPQFPCTKETAYQTVGKWKRQGKDDLAMADQTFPKEQYKPVLAKAQKVIELLMLANPEFNGIQAYAYRGIRGESYTPNGALPFRVNAVYDSYICVGNDTYIVEARGKVLLNGVTNWTTVNFNSLSQVLESVSISGSDDRTPEGEIFEFGRAVGELKGYTLLEPASRTEEKHEAVIIVPDGRLPYKPVSREQYLRARIKYLQDRSGSSADIASLNAAIGNMSPAERQTQAIVRDFSATPGRTKLFATEAEGGKRLVTIDKSFFNAKLPRDTIQLITVYWSWDEQNPSKALMIREFKQNFDFLALKQMLGK